MFQAGLWAITLSLFSGIWQGTNSCLVWNACAFRYTWSLGCFASLFAISAQLTFWFWGEGLREHLAVTAWCGDHAYWWPGLVLSAMVVHNARAELAASRKKTPAWYHLWIMLCIQSTGISISGAGKWSVGPRGYSGHSSPQSMENQWPWRPQRLICTIS